MTSSLSRFILVFLTLLTTSLMANQVYGWINVDGEKLIFDKYYYSDGFTMNNEQAVSLYGKVSGMGELGVTIHEKNLHNATELTAIKGKPIGLLTSTINWNGTSYVQSSKHNTFVKVQVLHVNKEVAQLNISGRYVSLKDYQTLIDIGASMTVPRKKPGQY